MAEKGAESLDDLLLGTAKEGVSETDEQIAARITAAQQKIVGIRRDEKKAKDFDLKLAKILRDLSPRLIEFIAFLIDSEIPSLTVLAMIIIASDEAGKICFETFGTPAKGVDFSLTKFEDPKISERVTLWWDFIFVADQTSKTLKLADLRENKKFVERVSTELSQMLRDFLIKNEVQNFSQAMLKKLLHKYEEKIFSNA